MSALDRPQPSALLTAWSVQPLLLVVTVVLAVWYAVAVRRLRARGERWPPGRSAVFALGVVVLGWTGNGFLQAYGHALFWAWTTQALVLMLVAPLLLVAGQPLHLARLTSRRAGWVDAFLASRVGRTLGNPLVGPALVPLLSAVLFFGPVAGWAVQSAAFGWVLHIVVLVIGGFFALPLVDTDHDATSLAIGLSLAIGSLELVLDAIPGIVLRLNTGVASTFFDHRTLHAWSPAQLHDQQVAGAIVWVISEVLDLPFLLLVYRRWLQADARDAAAADAVLDAERAARSALHDNAPADPDDAVADAPWWLSDPAMQARLRRRE